MLIILFLILMHRISSLSSSISSLSSSQLPKVIVFDLDATLWSPELYTLRRIGREKRIPAANKDVKLYPDVLPILSSVSSSHPDVKLAIASRTDKGPWARDLLNQFNLPVDPSLIEIYTGSKTVHFSSLAKKTRLPFSEMLFFDDARDGKHGNCEMVANMGVLSAYCPKPNGLTMDIFMNALERYAGGDRGMIVDPAALRPVMKTGTVKNYDPVKNYGFVAVRGENDVFFHKSSIAGGTVVSNGDEVEIEVGLNRGKVVALSTQLTGTPSSSPASSDPDKITITLPCFSMSQPFAAFLANSIKTIESRNHDMLAKVPPNTNVLLHINQKVRWG